MLTLSTFEEAAKKVKEVTQETKLIYSPNFSKETVLRHLEQLRPQCRAIQSHLHV